MKKIIVLMVLLFTFLNSSILLAQIFTASEESAGQKSDGSSSTPGYRIGRQAYSGGYETARTRYFFNLKSIPATAIIESVTLKANAMKQGSFYYTITQTDTLGKSTANLYTHIVSGPKLFEWIPYQTTNSLLTSTALTTIVNNHKGKTLTLGAFSQNETDSSSWASLLLTLEITLQTNVAITVTNNFQTSATQSGVIKIDNNQVPAPSQVVKVTGSNVIFEAITPQTDNNGYQRIWASNVATNESEWKKYNSINNILPINDNKNPSYPVENIAATENGMKYEANLRKICNFDCEINSQGGGTVSVTANGQTSVIYPGQNLQVSVTGKNPVVLSAADQTGNGIDYVFEKWAYTENGTSKDTALRTVTFNPEYHTNVTAYFKGYPNTSMMNVQNNITTVGAVPEITWTDNPNNNVSYKIQTRRYNSEAGYWEPWSSYISVAKGVGYYRKIGSVVNNNASGDGLNIKLEAYYSTENTMSLNAMNTTFNYTCLDCGGPINESKLNAGIQKETVVSKYALANYPNPFNPTTIINYQVPEAGHVTVKVYDVMGKEIATLVDGAKNKGSYNISFSMDQYHLSSGIYFCRMQSGKNITTTKMILSK